VTLGVDTHSDTHVAAILDHLGRLLGIRSFPSTLAGYHDLLSWASSYGDLHRAGVEGTGSYGAGLTRYLLSRDIEVLEIGRPNRQHRRRVGKSDPTDAEAAARTVLSGASLGQPKSSSNIVEMIRVLRASRRSALKARTQAANQLRAFILTAPDELRARLSPLPLRQLVSTAARLRASAATDVSATTRYALRSIARRYNALTVEISELDRLLHALVDQASPELVSRPGFGTDTVGALLVAAGDNPHRLRSEASFAHLCGVAPIPASSGKTVRYRLNRGGNRDANRALHIVALVRTSHDDRTRQYVVRRTSEGKTKPEIIRCLKRYIAREVYKILISPKLARKST
jgi:transposase